MKKVLNVGCALGIIAAILIAYAIWNYSAVNKRLANQRLLKWQMSWMDRKLAGN